MIQEREKLDGRLPATHVTPETAKKIRQIAKSENVKLAVVLRSAIEKFLSDYDSIAIKSKGDQS